MRRAAALGIGLAATLCGLPAAAQVPTATTSPAWSSQWSRVGPEDYGLTAALALGAGAAILLAPAPPRGFKTSFFPGEHAVADALSLDLEVRSGFVLASDILQNVLAAHPFVVDTGLAYLVHGDKDLAWQLFWINLQASAATTAVVMLTKRTIGRVRPITAPCAGTDDDFSCRSPATRRAFVSGHTAAAFTAAGLACVHHAHLDLYGGGFADRAICPIMIGLATLTGALRVMTREHWPSDVVAGAAVGLGFGYLLPKLVFYSPPADPSGPFRGALRLFAHGAIIDRGAQRAGVAAELGIEQRFELGPGRIALALDGQLLRAEGGLELRTLRTRVAAGLGVLDLGFALDVESQLEPDLTLTRISAGPTVALVLRGLGSDSTIQLVALPVGGAWDRLAVRLEHAPMRNLTFAVEIRTPGSLRDDRRAIVALLGVGGRVPW